LAVLDIGLFAQIRIAIEELASFILDKNYFYADIV